MDPAPKVGRARARQRRRHRHVARQCAEELPHRATCIFVFDRQGRVLVQRRTAAKDIYPSHHDLAAGGVVAAGESCEACAEREVQEELGIQSAALERNVARKRVSKVQGTGRAHDCAR